MTFTLDTGALIALERRKQRMADLVARARLRRDKLIVPQVVLAEWWRGRSDFREKILAMLVIEPLTNTCAKLAGEAVAHVRGASTIDAIVMASAASRSDPVFTSDPSDLERLRAYFPNVRVLSV